MTKQKLLLSIALIGGVSGQAYAQTGPVLDEITVTATKRVTTLADTPLAVSVIDGLEIAEKGIIEVTDLFNGIPGLGQNTSPGEFPAIKIRGIGTTNASQTLEQSIGLFLDGVYKPRARQYQDALFDVERVEVIKGAQGVVFGKNTNVGAISITARKPGDELGANLSASYETEFDSTLFQGGVDIPLSNVLKFRAAGLYSNRGGFVENTLTEDIDGDQDRWTARGTLVFNPVDRFTATLFGQHSDSETQGSSFQITGDPLGLPDFILDETPFQRAVDGETTVGGTTIPADFDQQESSDVALTLNLDLNENTTLTAITSYSQFDYSNAIDIFLAPFTPTVTGTGFIQFDEEFDQITQEVRVDYQNDKTRVLAGGFFQTQNIDFTTQVGLDFVIPASDPPALTDGLNAGVISNLFLTRTLLIFQDF